VENEELDRSFDLSTFVLDGLDFLVAFSKAFFTAFFAAFLATFSTIFRILLCFDIWRAPRIHRRNSVYSKWPALDRIVWCFFFVTARFFGSSKLIAPVEFGKVAIRFRTVDYGT
jgi:hypothetical protein